MQEKEGVANYPLNTVSRNSKAASVNRRWQHNSRQAHVENILKAQLKCNLLRHRYSKLLYNKPPAMKNLGPT